MCLNLYSLYDKVDHAYGQIILHRSDERASRSVVETFLMKNKQARDKGYPITNLIDYELHCLGCFNDETGEILPEDRMIPFIFPDSKEIIE